MICKYCGHELSDNSKFCIFCGNIIQHPEDMEIPVKVMHNTQMHDKFEDYKPKHGSTTDIEEIIEIPEIEQTPEIEIINIEKEKEKEPMHHNEEKLKMIQNFDLSSNKIVEPDKDEILGAITNKDTIPLEDSTGIVDEDVDIETIEEFTEVDNEVPIDNLVEEIKDDKPKKPEVVYLGNKFNFSSDRENKVLNILIVTFAAIAILLALKTFVF